MKGYVLPAGPVQPWEAARLTSLPALPALPAASLFALGETVQEIKAAGVSIMAVPALIAAGVAYVGFRLGKTDHGIPSILGYTVGTIGALAALGSILIMFGIVKAPIPDRPAQTTTEPMIVPSK